MATKTHQQFRVGAQVSPFAVACLLAVVSLGLAQGCDGLLVVPFGGGKPGGDVGAPDRNPPDPTNPTVAVRFANLTTDAAVNVRFHSTNDPIETLPDDLFTEENLITRDIGLAGSGILGPLATDEIIIPCTPDLTLGTMEAQFVDAETGDELGVGVARWAQEGPLGLCGGTVVFEFVRVGEEFDTRIILAN